MWALGIIGFALIADRAPFQGKRTDDIMRAIEKGKYTFTPEHIWDNISEDGKIFINGLLKFNPNDRLSVTEALNHQWIIKAKKQKQNSIIEEDNKNKKRPSSNCNYSTLMQEITDKLMLSNHRGLKRLALYTIASRINTQEINHIRQVFNEYDILNNGTICFDEFKSALHQVQYKYKYNKYTDEQLYE